MKYCRMCPICNDELCTDNKYYHEKALTSNKTCVSCSRKGKQFTDEHKKNLSKSHADVSGEKNPFWGKTHSEETRKLLSEINTGKDRFSDQYKRQLSERMRGHGNPFFKQKHSDETLNKLRMPKSKEHIENMSKSRKGKPTGRKFTPTSETRRKMRLSAIERIKRTHGCSSFLPNINPKETDYFYRLETDMGWDGIYFGKNGEKQQYFIKSLGYWVDFYDPLRNIVVEYDEPRHYNANWVLCNRDIRRQKEIISELGCEFYRYNERLNTLTKYDQNYEQ